MSEFSVDPDMLAAQEQVRELYNDDPLMMAAAVGEQAAQRQIAELVPAIEETLSFHRQAMFESTSDQAVEAMDKLYGDTWRPYQPAVSQYIEENRDIFDAVGDNPQKMAERLQAAYRTVKPMVDAEQSEGQWDRIKVSYREYGDTRPW